MRFPGKAARYADHYPSHRWVSFTKKGGESSHLKIARCAAQGQRDGRVAGSISLAEIERYSPR